MAPKVLFLTPRAAAIRTPTAALFATSQLARATARLCNTRCKGRSWCPGKDASATGRLGDFFGKRKLQAVTVDFTRPWAPTARSRGGFCGQAVRPGGPSEHSWRAWYAAATELQYAAMGSSAPCACCGWRGC
jgi:hypothetical protein